MQIKNADRKYFGCVAFCLCYKIFTEESLEQKKIHIHISILTNNVTLNEKS